MEEHRRQALNDHLVRLDVPAYDSRIRSRHSCLLRTCVKDACDGRTGCPAELWGSKLKPPAVSGSRDKRLGDYNHWTIS